MVSRLFSRESFTSSGFTPGSSATIFTASLSSNTSQAGYQDEVIDPLSCWNGQLEKASSSTLLSRRRVWKFSKGRRVEIPVIVFSKSGKVIGVPSRQLRRLVHPLQSSLRAGLGARRLAKLTEPARGGCRFGR